MAGYVRLYRDSMDHPVFQDDWLWRLFCWCVMKANFVSGTMAGKKIPRGSFVTGRFSGSEQLGVAPSKFYRGLHRLAELGCISVKSNSNWTTVTVCNYKTYQPSADTERTESEHQSNRSAEHQSNRSNPNVTNDFGATPPDSVNINRTASEQQSNTEKEFNKGRREEVNTGQKSEADLLGGFQGHSQTFEVSWCAYPAFRRSKKTASGAAWDEAVSKLAGRFEGSRRLAEDWLHKRVLAFSKCPLAKGRSKYCPSLLNWLTDGRFDDPPEAWADEEQAQASEDPYPELESPRR